MMQTTLADVRVIVLCSAVQNCILFGLFMMLLQSYSILDKCTQLCYRNYLQNESQQQFFMVIFVFSTPKYYRLGPFSVRDDFTVNQCSRSNKHRCSLTCDPIL